MRYLIVICVLAGLWPVAQAQEALPISEVTASSYLKGSTSYLPENATDGSRRTWWTPGEKRNGAGEWLRISFETPVLVEDIELLAGSYTPDHPTYGDLWQQNCRLKEGELRFSDGSSQRFTLNDEQAIQTVHVGGATTTYVELRFASVYNGSRWQDLCISWFKARGRTISTGGSLAGAYVPRGPKANPVVTISLDEATGAGSMEVQFIEGQRTEAYMSEILEARLEDDGSYRLLMRDSDAPDGLTNWERFDPREWERISTPREDLNLAAGRTAGVFNWEMHISAYLRENYLAGDYWIITEEGDTMQLSFGEQMCNTRGREQECGDYTVRRMTSNDELVGLDPDAPRYQAMHLLRFDEGNKYILLAYDEQGMITGYGLEDEDRGELGMRFTVRQEPPFAFHPRGYTPAELVRFEEVSLYFASSADDMVGVYAPMELCAPELYIIKKDADARTGLMLEIIDGFSASQMAVESWSLAGDQMVLSGYMNGSEALTEEPLPVTMVQLLVPEEIAEMQEGAGYDLQEMEKRRALLHAERLLVGERAATLQYREELKYAYFTRTLGCIDGDCLNYLLVRVEAEDYIQRMPDEGPYAQLQGCYILRDARNPEEGNLSLAVLYDPDKPGTVYLWEVLYELEADGPGGRWVTTGTPPRVILHDPNEVAVPAPPDRSGSAPEEEVMEEEIYIEEYEEGYEEYEQAEEAEEAEEEEGGSY